MVGVIPEIFCSVDIVGIDEGGVAAAVDDVAGVGLGDEVDRRAAVGDVGQDRGCDFGEAVDGGFAVIGRSECAWNHVSRICPNRVMSSAVSINKTIDDTTRTILNGIYSVKYSRNDCVAAYILDGGRCGASGIGSARDSVCPVGGDVNDGVWQGDVINEAPCSIRTGTVLICEGKGLRTNAILNTGHCYRFSDGL